jgi:hypothetical protein
MDRTAQPLILSQRGLSAQGLNRIESGIGWNQAI